MNFISSRQFVFGLTGGMLCGKSEALRAFARAGAFTLSADDLVREISARPAVQRKIRALLGITGSAAVAQKIFTQPAARKKLEILLHPLVLKEMESRLKADKTPVRAVEVPLLFEAGLQEFFDVTVAVAAPAQVLAARAKKRGISQTDFLRRSKAQLSQEEKAARADVCLLNNATTSALEEKVRALYRAATYLSKE